MHAYEADKRVEARQDWKDTRGALVLDRQAGIGAILKDLSISVETPAHFILTESNRLRVVRNHNIVVVIALRTRHFHSPEELKSVWCGLIVDR